MKTNFKKIYTMTLIILLSITFGYGTCYLVNKDKIERNNYDVNNDNKVDILDLLKLQKYLIEEQEKEAKEK